MAECETLNAECAPPRSEVRPPSEYCPLLITQEEVLIGRELLRRAGGQLSANHIQFGFRVAGVLNRSALSEALDEIVRRHSGLRAVVHFAPGLTDHQREAGLAAFKRTGMVMSGLYAQTTREHVCLELGEYDFTRLEAEPQAEAIRRALSDAVMSPFDYGSEPLLRACLLRISAEEHLLGIVVDHLACDRWSLEIISDELPRLYEAFDRGAPNPLEPTGPSHLEFTLRQPEMLQRAGLKSIRYWRQQWSRFGGARIPAYALPFHAPSAEKVPPVFDREFLDVDPTLSACVRDFARIARVSLHILFTAAYGMVLSAYTQRETVALWGHFANRKAAPGYDRAVGLFAHTHFLGLEFSGSVSRLDALARVKAAVLGASENEALPLPYLWQALRCHPCFPDLMPLLDVRAERAPRGHPSDAATVRFDLVTLPFPPSARRSPLGVYVNVGPVSLSLHSAYVRTIFPSNAVQALLSDILATVIELMKPDKPVAGAAAQAAHRYAGYPKRASPEMGEYIIFGSDLLPDIQEA